MTTAFTSAADLMARSLGAEGYRYAVIEHPISSASAEVLGARAREAIADIMAILMRRE